MNTYISFDAIDVCETWWIETDDAMKLAFIQPRFDCRTLPVKPSFDFTVEVGLALIAANETLTVHLRFPHMDKNFMLWAEGTPRAIEAFNAVVCRDIAVEQKKAAGLGMFIFHQVGHYISGEQIPNVSGWEYWIDRDSTVALTNMEAHAKSVAKRFGMELQDMYK